ncbi:hypothetical protein QN277_025848 [Acacia crassicarpa]|uniref:Helicase C-terminal domain-containing protein n=1 Tax=Acacia crassicarpa TaxID=499986 RepID=A0AAE1K5P7_9FABA|nr:hypothetical protein QN277_025848 [Acacia crassicarpa]
MRFKEKFGSHISYGRDKGATKENKRLSSSAAKELRDRVQPYFLRRTKSEVVGAKISNKHEIVVWLRLTNIQQHLYKEFLSTVNYKTWDYGEPFAALKIMRKICDHPLLLRKRDLSKGIYRKLLHIEEANLVDKLELRMKDVRNTYNFKVEHEISCKLSFIMSLLGNLIPQGHHVLIFSGSLKMLDLIQESLLSKGYKFSRIDGTTKAEDRTKIVDDFQQHAVAPIFLLSSKVGGLGLTLTRADRVIVTDPDWNPSTDDQIVDRACRVGQAKEVVAYRLITCGTLEDKAYRKQVFKDGLCKTGTEHKEKARHFSWNDHRYPFTPPKKGFDVSVTQQQLEKKYDWEETMDESFKEHIDFLRSLGIAGVTHHNELLSIEASDDEDDPENYEATRTESALYSKRAKLRSKSSSPNSLGQLSEPFARKANRDMMDTWSRKLECNDVRFAQESNEWKHKHQRQKTTVQAK